MSDVRSMLRMEREKRKVTHPHASYTTDGKLLCNLCEIPVKSETAWQSHLHSSQHTLRLSRARDAAAARREDGGSKKRKASDRDSPPPEERKRSKPAAPSSPSLPRLDEQKRGKPVEEGEGESVHLFTAPDEAKVVESADNTEEVSAAQLAAFDRQLADMEAAMNVTSAPTISAAPMTAAEIAAQAREEQSAQRERRDAEREAEKEDAARLLEDELEEMETLEERVRKLRERREALRDRVGSEQADGVENESAQIDDGAQARSANAAEGENDRSEKDEEDDDEEDDNVWNFGGQ